MLHMCMIDINQFFMMKVILLIGCAHLWIFDFGKIACDVARIFDEQFQQIAASTSPTVNLSLIFPAYWISMQAIKTVFDTEDGLNKSPYDITYVKEQMMQFYELKSKIGILDHLHKKFDKPKFAQFCRLLALVKWRFFWNIK